VHARTYARCAPSQLRFRVGDQETWVWGSGFGNNLLILVVVELGVGWVGGIGRVWVA
jgi:hypothetical protein